MMLYAFDLDGTLVENHLVDARCPVCEGTGAHPHSDGGDRCWECRGKGTKLIQGPQAYTEPVLRPGVGEFVQEHARAGDVFAIVTNQAGVAFGHHTVADFHVRVGQTLLLLDYFGGRPFTIHVCFDHPNATDPSYADPDECKRRKPSGRMLVEAVEAHGVGPLGTTFIGDLPTDRECARDASEIIGAAPVDFIDANDLFRHPEGT